MRRTDYILIAQTLAQALNECRREPVSGVILTIEQFADNLSIDNIAFNKQQFIDNIALYTINERGQDSLKTLKNKYQLTTVKEI